MVPTSAQIAAALSYTSVFNLYSASLTPPNQVDFADATNWISIGIDTGVGDTIEYLYQAIDPAGIPFYENAGYTTDDYTAPDADTLNADLPLDANGDPIAGTYFLRVKVKVTPLGLDPIYSYKQLEFEVCPEVVSGEAKVSITFNCQTAQASAHDDSNINCDKYSSITTVRTLRIIPPETSGQAPVASAGQIATVGSLLSPVTYEADVELVKTFTNTSGTTQVIARYYASTEEKSNCDDSLCTIYCCLKKVENDFAGLANDPSEQKKVLQKLILGTVYYTLAVGARECGHESLIPGYVEKFFEVTGCDPKCDCCSDTAAPVIAGGNCSCEDGANGREIELQVTGGGVLQSRYVGTVPWTTLINFNDIGSLVGKSFLILAAAPVSGDGNVGDSALVTGAVAEIWNVYLKTGPTTWVLQGNIKGAAGAAGLSILTNSFPQTVTTTTSYETLGSNTLAANLFATNGDEVDVIAEYQSLAANNDPNQLLKILVGGTTAFTLQGPAFSSDNYKKIVVKASIIRTGAYELTVRPVAEYYDLDGTSYTEQLIGTTRFTDVVIGLVNFAATIAVLAQAKSVTIGDIRLDYFKVLFQKKP